MTELRVFIGVTGSELFARRPQKVAVAMPCYEYIWLVDLNKDAKSAYGRFKCRRIQDGFLRQSTTALM